MNIRALLGLPDVLEAKRVLAIQPHPDDNEVNIAGTLIELGERGCEIIYVTVTDGSAGAFGEEQRADHIVETRFEEKKNAGDIVGVHKHIDLGYPDGRDYTVASLVGDLVQIYREEQPDLVFSVDPWMPYEAHPDHVKVGTAAARAMIFSKNNILYPPKGEVSCYQVPQIAFYATSHPNTFVDVTAHWEQKMASILAHRSQFDNDTWDMMKTYFSFIATESFKHIEQGNQGYAETLKVLAHQQLHSVPSTLYS